MVVATRYSTNTPFFVAALLERWLCQEDRRYWARLAYTQSPFSLRDRSICFATSMELSRLWTALNIEAAAPPFSSLLIFFFFSSPRPIFTGSTRAETERRPVFVRSKSWKGRKETVARNRHSIFNFPRPRGCARIIRKNKEKQPAIYQPREESSTRELIELLGSRRDEDDHREQRVAPAGGRVESGWVFDISLNRASSIISNLSFLFLCDDAMRYYPTFRINFFFFFFLYRIFNQAFSLYYIIV